MKFRLAADSGEQPQILFIHRSICVEFHFAPRWFFRQLLCLPIKVTYIDGLTGVRLKLYIFDLEEGSSNSIQTQW